MLAKELPTNSAMEFLSRPLCAFFLFKSIYLLLYAYEDYNEFIYSRYNLVISAIETSLNLIVDLNLSIFVTIDLRYSLVVSIRIIF